MARLRLRHEEELADLRARIQVSACVCVNVCECVRV